MRDLVLFRIEISCLLPSAIDFGAAVKACNISMALYVKKVNAGIS